MRRGRPPHDDILTPREWEVAELIQQGLTNEQIAERLSISFGGAKYHVSEIISKLGISSRDEVAAWLQEPRVAAKQSRAGILALLPSLLGRGGTALRPITAMAAVGLVAAVVVSGLLVLGPFSAKSPAALIEPDDEISGSDFGIDFDGLLTGISEAKPFASYYFEAVGEYEQGEPPVPPGREPPARAPLPGQANNASVLIKAWAAGPDEWKWEAADGNGEPGLTQVYSGGVLYLYQGDSNLYSRGNLPPSMQGEPGPQTYQIGPLSPRRAAFWFQPGGDWRIIGQEEIAGRTANVVEITGQDYITRIWMDTEYAFVLRYDSDSAMSTQSTTVTHIDYEARVRASDLAFVAPPLAREVPPIPEYVTGSGMVLGPFGSTHAPAPDGMLDLTYVPDGYLTIGGAASSDGSDRTLSYSVTYGLNGGKLPTLTIQQQLRAGGIPASQAVGDAIPVGNTMGYDQSTPGEQRLVVGKGDIIVTLFSTTLDMAELVKIAEGMQ